MQSLVVLAILVVATSSPSTARDIGVGKLQEVLAWKQLSYDLGDIGTSNRYFSQPSDASDSDVAFPDQSDPGNVPAPADGTNEPAEGGQAGNNFFIPYNNVPMGVDRWKNKLFITVPRRRNGIPATLNYVEIPAAGNDNKSPGLRPYPDLKTNTLVAATTGEYTPLVNIYRTTVDVCDRLWFVDTGIMEIPDNFQAVQPPALVVYDLNTDTLLHRYLLRSEDMVNDNPVGFASVTVDVDASDCANAFAYLPDLATYGVVVYSLKEDTSWRMRHNYFYLDPEEGDFNLNGIRFTWNDGVFSIALSRVNPDGFRTAYFHAMASQRERSVSTAILRNATLATRAYHEADFKTIGNRGPNSQTTMHAVHPESRVMFGAMVGSSALSCWNTRKELSPKTLGIVAKDALKFMYPSDLKIEKDNVWIMTNRLPMFIYSTLNPEEVNFRLYRVKVQDAIKGTVCA